MTLTLLLAEAALRLLPAPARFLSADEIWRAQAIDPGAALFRDGLEIRGVTYRDTALPEEAFGPGAERLLFLGDSFTVGWGLARRDDRFSDRIERSLAAERVAGPYIFNAARGGTNPDQWSRYLEDLLPVVQPRGVVAVFFLRDGTLLGTSLQLNRRELDPIHARARARFLYDRSALLTFFWDRLAWREYTELFTGKIERSYLGTESERAMWNRQQRALLNMATRCRKAGVSFDLVIFPMLFELDDYAFHAVEQEIERFAERSGIRVFSLTPAFLGRTDHELWVASNDQHPNALGHEIAAERLLPHVRDVVLAKRERE